ncbi:MAG: hypothetical protein JWR61_3605 [Ferruginibacter sp.]|nr:hypothetical protein [Ferruginibacter sp.]
MELNIFVPKVKYIIWKYGNSKSIHGFDQVAIQPLSRFKQHTRCFFPECFKYSGGYMGV